MPQPPREHGRFSYSAIVDRPPLRWPNDARVALWVIPNIEHFLFDRPATSVSQNSTRFLPDVLNYSWRDYGVRVGIWRLMEIMHKHGVRGTAALNSAVCTHYPRIIEEGNTLGWEWMGHGVTNSIPLDKQNEDEERALIDETLATIAASAGKRPRGWLSPGLSETHRTLDLLAGAGVEYVCNWTNDEQPYPMRVKTGSLVAMPYSSEINDIPAMLGQHKSGAEFAQMICDQFDVLHEDGTRSGRVMAICLHPFLIGVPHRAKYLDQALAYIRSQPSVWLATGSEILDHYKKHASGTAAPR